MRSGRSAARRSSSASVIRRGSGSGRSIRHARSSKKLAGKSNACDWTSCGSATTTVPVRSEEHTSELQSHSDLVCRLLLEKKKKKRKLRRYPKQKKKQKKQK